MVKAKSNNGKGNRGQLSLAEKLKYLNNPTLLNKKNEWLHLVMKINICSSNLIQINF